MVRLACNRALAAAALGRNSDAVRDCTLAIEIDGACCKVNIK